MTDPLLRIEAVIETLGGREAEFWTPLDTPQAQVSNPKPLENRGFGHFGRFGHPRENPFTDGLIESDTRAAESDADTRRTCSRASSLLHEGVQSVQSVQNDQKGSRDQLVGFGHLGAASVQNRGTGVQKSAGEPLDHRVAQVAPAGDAPVDWAEGVALLREATAPHGYPQHAWQQLILDAARFVDDWAAQAAVLGWPAWELFGCHRRAPWGRIDGMGLVLLLKGNAIVAVTPSEAVIRTRTGARQIYRCKSADPLLPVERCLVWELQDA